MCFLTFDHWWVFTCFWCVWLPVCTLCKHQCTCCWYVHVCMLRCLQSVPYGLSHVQPCKEYTVSACLLGMGAGEAYVRVMWTCFLPCGSPAPVWSRNLLPACTCSSSVSSAWSSPPCLNLSTETGDCHMGLMTGAGWVEEHSVVVRGKLLLSYELWKGQV